MFKKSIFTIIGLSVGLMGCQNLTNQDTGVMAGGLVGGLLGSQFGGGSGKIAAAVGGAMLGAYLGGSIGKTMDKVDQMQMQRALETEPTGRQYAWKNPDNGNQYTVRPTRTYYTNQQPCREYTTHAIIGGKTQEVYGKACRQTDGSWRIVK